MKRGESGLAFIFGVNKPAGMTSHDAVARVRRALGEKRVGHAGTLDPPASGVLVIGVGQGTRLLGQLMQDDKRYIGRIRFGTRTGTDDALGKVLEEGPLIPELLDEDFARETLSSFIGPQNQVPPQYSAISVDGKRAYARARAGEEVNLGERPITIHEASLISIDDCDGVAWTCAFKVSKGTYIRSIARDVGYHVDVPAHLEALERISSGTISLSACVTLEELAELGPEGIKDHIFDPLALCGLPHHVLTDDELARSVTGSPLPTFGFADWERVALVHDGRLMGIWVCKLGKLWCESNFPGGIEGVRDV